MGLVASQGLFNSFVREYRPLSGELDNRVRPVQQVLDSATRAADLDALEGERLAALLDRIRPEAPRLSGARAASTREGDLRWNPDRTSRVPTTRHHVAVRTVGEVELLGYWPDGAPTDLVAVDEETVDGLGGLDTLTTSAPEDVSRYWDASQMWVLGMYDDGESTTLHPALYTHVDLTREEEHLVATGRLDVQAEFERRRRLIEPIVEAIGRQIDTFFSQELPERIAVLVGLRRAELHDRRAVSDSLVFPDQWHLPEPTLARRAADSERPGGWEAGTPGPSDGVRTPDRRVETETEAAAVRVGDIGLDNRTRLSGATFSDVLGVMRKWSDSIERYPAAFGELPEDRISDLLAATLNATLPGADREVYTRSGKSDIFIRADDVQAGRGPARVFICETKWATSRAVIREALDPQLFGNLNVHDTRAVLLILMRQADFAAAKERYTEVLQQVDGHRSTEAGPVEGWPVLTYRTGGRVVEVCAAFVHLGG